MLSSSKGRLAILVMLSLLSLKTRMATIKKNTKKMIKDINGYTSTPPIVDICDFINFNIPYLIEVESMAFTLISVPKRCR